MQQGLGHFEFCVDVVFFVIKSVLIKPDQQNVM